MTNKTNNKSDGSARSYDARSHEAGSLDGAHNSVVVSSSVQELKIFIVAGEQSGDQLGGVLMSAINAQRKGRVRYFGVGGPKMAAQGLVSQFSIDDIAVMGLGAIIKRLPKLTRRVYQTVEAAISCEPDVIVIIDAPEFTHRVATRIRARAPKIPIICYVSPSVWAWRPGRARKMAAYVDHILALLPFEPDTHKRLGGPPCSYVGHPLIEKAPWLESLDTSVLRNRLKLDPGRPVLAILPGSRTTEVSRLMEVFSETAELLSKAPNPPEIIIPVVEHVSPLVRTATSNWSIRPHLVYDEEDKFAAFKLADGALAASGTVTLELAVAGTPMIVAYRIGAVFYQVLLRMAKAKSAVLANLVLDDIAFPEFLQGSCTASALAPAVTELLRDTPARRFQLKALARIPEAMAVPGGSPGAAAARIVLLYADKGRTGVVVDFDDENPSSE